MEAPQSEHPAQNNTQLGLTAEATQGMQSQPWMDLSASAASQLAQLDPAQLTVLQQAAQPTQTVQLTPDQLAALTGALNGNTDLSALTGALGANSDLLQRLMIAPAEEQPADQPAINIELPRAPELVSNSFMLQDNPPAGTADTTTAPAAAHSAQEGLQQAGLVLSEGTATVANLQQQQQQGMLLAGDAGAVAGQDPGVMATAAVVSAAAGLPEELQLQLQRGVKRKAGDNGEPQADSDVADILLAMAGNPALKKLAQQQGGAQLAAAAAAGVPDVNLQQLPGQPDAAAADPAGAVATTVDGAGQLQVASDAAAAAADDLQTATLLDQHGQQVSVNLSTAGLTDAAGNPLAGLDLNALAASGAFTSVSGGISGLSLDMQSLGGAGMLQIADLSRLQGLQASGGQSYAALPGMQGLQLVQLPMQGDLNALQQTAGYGAAADDDNERPAKRAKEEALSADGSADVADGIGGMATAVGDGVTGGLDAATAAGLSGLEGQALDLQQAADANAAAQAAAAAIGTVVNVNGVNMLIPAAPQLQLQLAPDASMQDQLLALQQQVQLAQLPLMGGLGSMQLPTAGINLATATPDQVQTFIQTQQLQQLQQLQLQQQLQLMQLQLAGQGGLVLAGGGPRLLGIDTDGSGHMVRRHGVLPERLVTRDMLKQVFHLPIEEAAKHLGIGQTMLKHYCRKFGIPRWPYRKRQSVVQLISSIENYAADKPQIVEPALQKLRSFLAQIDEDPNIDLDGPIKRLRQAFFKEAYKARVRKQQNDSGDDRRGGRPGGGRSEAWLENLCQAIVDSNHPHLPEGGVGGHDVGGFELPGGDDGDDMGGHDPNADDLAAAIHHHAQHHQVSGLQHQALDPNALAMAAAAAQLAGVGGLPGQEGLAAAGLDDPALVAAAAAAQAQAQQEQLAALQAAVSHEQHHHQE